jgi:hypothetical protein
MKMKIKAAISLLALLVVQGVWAQTPSADGTDMQALRAAVKADKKALVAATLALTPVEATKFWPLYDRYQATLDMINRRRNVALEGLIAQDKPLSDLYAKNLANELIATDEAEIKARRTLQNRLTGIMAPLPAKKAARYLQLEFDIRAVLAYDIAAAIPLVK